MPSYNRPHVYVSQDGDHGEVTAVISEMAAKFAAKHSDVPFTHLRHPQIPAVVDRKGAPVPGWAVGYYKLSQHFGWALGQLFDGKGHPRVIVLEDDIEIAVDFFDFFSAVEPLLDTDRQLLAASAWSDLGQGSLVGDPRQVHRTDFFPGLGWMLTRHAWEELGPKWPEGFWDDWLREPPQRQGRHFLRPEVSRTFTFGEEGVSQSQFYSQYLATIRLNDVRVDWGGEDTRYLELAVWDAEFTAALAAAREMGDLESFFAASCPSDGGGAAVLSQDLLYVALGEGSYMSAANRFSFIPDIKAGVPRTAYKGTVTLKHKGCRKFITYRP